MRFRLEDSPRGQHLYPVLSAEGELAGVLTRKDMIRLLTQESLAEHTLEQHSRTDPVTALADEPLRVVVYRMAETGFTRLPVVTRDGKLAGMVSLNDLLGARARNLAEERRRERVLRLRPPFGSRDRSGAPPDLVPGSPV